MQIPIYQIDAFTQNLFRGNPAAVCPLETWLPTQTMQNIAAENNLAETAFFVPESEGFAIRWFTPKAEVDLCGHATLAASWVIFNELHYDQEEIVFTSKSGKLGVTRQGQLLALNFPADFSDPVDPPEGLYEAIGAEPVTCYKGKTDYLLIYETQKQIEQIQPNFAALDTISDARGVIVSAPGDIVDFVSRFFAPQVGVNEDPVTGSAHTTLAPYWYRNLAKTSLHAHQLSERGGDLKIKMLGNRVEIAGKAIKYLEGKIYIPE